MHSDWVYNGLDCCVTLEIKDALIEQLDENTQQVYDFSRALQAPVMDMQLRGMFVDKRERKRMVKQLKADIEHMETNLNRLFTEVYDVPNINWRSPKQLKEFFYGLMEYKPIKKRAAGNKWLPSVDREAIEKLSTYHYARPVCSHVLALRDAGKKLGFLETGIDPDGVMRSAFNIAGTTTGRFASAESDFGTGTNLQNVGRPLRHIFVPRAGMKYGNLDLEQADARNLGALCWNIFMSPEGRAFAENYYDEQVRLGARDSISERAAFKAQTPEQFAGSFLDACESGDLHTTVAMGAYFHLPWSDDMAENKRIADDKNNYAYRDFTYRDQAKRLGHGSNFYGKPRTMSLHTKIPVADVKTFQENYFRRFPVIPMYHRWVRKQLVETNSLTTLLGRRRYFWNRPEEDKTLRDAIAYCPQSMTADEINTGILNLWRANTVQLLLQVHDSILFEFPEHLEAEIIPWALEALRTEITLVGGRKFSVPTEAKIGWNYGDESKDNPYGLAKWRGQPDTRKFGNGETLR